MQAAFAPDPASYPFTSRWFESTAGSIHYIDEGEGTPILLCHGAPTWSFLFRKVITALAGQFRCIALDYPGFGLSARPPDFGYTIAEITAVAGDLVDYLDLNRYLVLGHDWGGPVGVGLSVDRAERVAGIALTNTALWPITAFPNRVFSAVMSTRPMQRRILENNLLIEKFLLGSAGPDLSSTEADQYRIVQPDPQARRALAVMPRQIRDARSLLAQLEVNTAATFKDTPALAIWGMRDPVFRPHTCLRRMRRMFSDLEVVELPGAGHFTPENAPADIAAAITQRFGIR